MFNGLFGIGRSYRKLPPHHNFAQLADNVEQLANYLMGRSLGKFAKGANAVGMAARQRSQDAPAVCPRFSAP